MKESIERVLVLLKPDAVQRGLMGEVLSRFEHTGLKFVAFKFLIPTTEQCAEHYHKEEKWFLKAGTRAIESLKNNNMPIEKDATDYGKSIIRALEKYLTSGPVLVVVLEGNQSVAIVKKLVGETEPRTSDVGTVRGDLTVDSYEIAQVYGRAVRNLVHCSGTPEEAIREISIWFSDEEILNYRLVQEQILYDVNIDGILE